MIPTLIHPSSLGLSSPIGSLGALGHTLGGLAQLNRGGATRKLQAAKALLCVRGLHADRVWTRVWM